MVVKISRSPLVIVDRIVAVMLVSFLGASMVVAQEDEAYRIQWRDYTLYSNVTPAPLSEALVLPGGPLVDQENYYFVQFSQPIDQDLIAQVVDGGAQLLNYVPNNAFIAKMNGAAAAKVRDTQGVQWVGAFRPEMRVSRRLRMRIDSGAPEARPPLATLAVPPAEAALAPERLELIVQVFPGHDLDSIQQAVENAGGRVEAAKAGERRSKLRVNIPAGNALSLALVDGVSWIEPYDRPTLFNDRARGVLNVTPVWNSHGLQGSGQIVGIADTGLDSGVDDATMHDDFAGRIANIFSLPVGNFSDINNPGANDGAADLDSGHGTHVAGSVLGNGAMSGGLYSGVAPEARVVFQAVEQFVDLVGSEPDEYQLAGLPLDLNDLFQEAYDAGARIHTNSWGSQAEGTYSSYSEDVDEFVWNNPDMLVLFAAGNAGRDDDGDNVVDQGSVNPPGTAKNALTVGASENERPTAGETYRSSFDTLIDSDRMADDRDGMAAFSSRGPANSDTPSTADDRIKPDLVAPGTMIASVRSQASPNKVLFMDDMENGLNGWTAGGNWTLIDTDSRGPNRAWHDSPAGNYADGTDASLMSPQLDLSGGGLGAKTLQLWMRYELAVGDEWRLEVSQDGGASWPGLGFTGVQGGWELFSISLAGFSQAANFRIRFRLLSNSDGATADGLYIDGVRIVEGTFGASRLSDQGLARAGSDEDENYVLFHGTSMATPLVAGTAAVVRQYYADVELLTFISGALVRATLTNGANDISPGQYLTGPHQEISARPNNVEGWGRVDLSNSVVPDAPAVLQFRDRANGLETADGETYELEITSADVPLVVTMVYHDYPGPTIVNNLDLSITTPGGETIFPNGRNGPDTNNNVEQISIPVPQLGVYTISIDAPNVPLGPQPYALVTSAAGALTDGN